MFHRQIAILSGCQSKETVGWSKGKVQVFMLCCAHVGVCWQTQTQCTLLVRPEHHIQRCANAWCDCMLGYCVASSGRFLPTFRNIFSVPFQGSRVQKESWSSKPTNQPTKEPANQPINQPKNQPTNHTAKLRLVGCLLACLDRLSFPHSWPLKWDPQVVPKCW